MRTGDLNQKVTILADASTRGASSGAIKQWTTSTTVATVWGNLRPIGGGRETFGSPDMPASRAEYVLTIYHRADVTPKNRVQVDTRTFEIVSVGRVRDTELYMALRLVEVV